MSPPDELIAGVVAALDGAEIPYMLTGSTVSSIHGRARATHDIDVVIDPPNAYAATKRLLSHFQEGYYADLRAAEDAVRQRAMFNVIHHASGWKVDFIVRKRRPFSVAEFERRREIVWRDQKQVVATAEDTVIAKLEWSKNSGSARQLEDVAAILAVQGDALDRGYIEHWVADLGLAEPWSAAQALG